MCSTTASSRRFATPNTKPPAKSGSASAPNTLTTPVAAAQAEFLRLGMNQSPERNGVLIFVAPRAHKFAVIGDEAVHAKCGDEFWRKLADAMTGYFRKSEFTPGIIHGVQKAGELLAEHFPRQRG